MANPLGEKSAGRYFWEMKVWLSFRWKLMRHVSKHVCQPYFSLSRGRNSGCDSCVTAVLSFHVPFSQRRITRLFPLTDVFCHKSVQWVLACATAHGGGLSSSLRARSTDMAATAQSCLSAHLENGRGTEAGLWHVRTGCVLYCDGTFALYTVPREIPISRAMRVGAWPLANCSLARTQIIESMNRVIRQTCRNVKRSRNAKMP